MYTQLERPYERKVKVVTRSTTQKKPIQKNRNRITTNIVQRLYKFDGITFSQAAKYGIRDSDRTKLYVDKLENGPMPSDLFQSAGEEDKGYATIPITNETLEMSNKGSEKDVTYTKRFNIFVPKIAMTGQDDSTFLPNDCGMYARALMFNDQNYKYDTDIHKGTEYIYDDTDLDSKTCNAKIGEMYNMMTDRSLGQHAHHAATVVAKDGEDHITSEAFAGTGRKTPLFEMYGKDNDSFWARWSERYKRGDKEGEFFVRGKEKREFDKKGN